MLYYSCGKRVKIGDLVETSYSPYGFNRLEEAVVVAISEDEYTIVLYSSTWAAENLGHDGGPTARQYTRENRSVSDRPNGHWFIKTMHYQARLKLIKRGSEKTPAKLPKY